MCFSRFTCCLVLILFTVIGCGTDLAPSAKDQQPPVQCGITGARICQNAPDFTLSDSLGNVATLSSVLSSPTTSGVVMYFTMWCPTCDGDMSNMRDTIIPSFPNVTFFAVDYVSGTVEGARNAETSNGYAGSRFIVLADTGQKVLDLYNGTMATTIVIDRNGIVRMNESYKSGKLIDVLKGLP